MTTRKCLGLLLSLFAFIADAAEQLKITVSHDLLSSRPAETITVPWAEVNRALPGALLQHLEVKDAAGRILPYQVTNISPQAKDPTGAGVAYGELIFQHDFPDGEQSATFTVEKTETVAPVFPTQAFARYIPERLDDFAWENDKIAHRTYGPALAAQREPDSGKEVLISSGLDVWVKRVNYPIVDRWYNKGHDHYHHDEGEGMDLYGVGTSRGCGGTGVWDGSQLHVGRNYQNWRVVANGPIRTVFELTYDNWAANGVFVSEVKRITLDAGHNLNLVESTFTVTGNSDSIIVGVGLNKNPADKGQDPQINADLRTTAGSMTQWIEQRTNGDLGTAVLIPGDEFQGFAEDEKNLLALAQAKSGQTLRYFVGAGWSKAGDFISRADWEGYVAFETLRIRSPVRIALSSLP